MGERTVVTGAGMVPFVGPGSQANTLAQGAIARALDDARVDVDLVDQAIVSRVHGDWTSSEHALAGAGLAGIPITSVSSGSASGSVALFHARQALLSGEAQCVLAVGFEDAVESLESPYACIGNTARAADLMGLGDETFARVAVKARAYGARNPCGRHRMPLTIAEALASPLIGGRVRRSYLSEPSCGAAAVLLCTPRFAAHHGLRDDVLLLSHALATDDTDDGDAQALPAGTATARVAERAYEGAGVDPADIDVAEVHDCCVADELIACTALGLCAQSALEAFVASGANVHISPSGGQLSLGQAPGATGLAQVCEIVWQLRGEAGPRQLPGAPRIGLQHNGGSGGAIAVAILRRKDR